jgi:hypothetical protein
MITLPSEIMTVLGQFAPVFSERIWDWVQVLVAGAILAPGKRTVSSLLRAVGLQQEKQYQNYHRVLNRAKWSGLEVSRMLLAALLKSFVKDQPLVLAADETLERRRGSKIRHLGCFRDAARSTKGNKVKSFGLRWISMMVVSQVPWSPRRWALPFLTVLAPGLQSDQQAARRHKSSIDWIRQMICQVRRWLPDHRLVLVVDGGLACLKLGQTCQGFATPVTYVTRLQHNARLFDLPPQTPRKRGGRPQVVGMRHPLLAQLTADAHTVWQRAQVQGYNGQPQSFQWVSQVALWYSYGRTPLPGRAVWITDPSKTLGECVLFATDPQATATQIIEWFVLRWNVEVTFEEVRAHLGFETQRQWSVLAIRRSSPAILGLFSFVTLLAHHLLTDAPLPIRSTAWYCKSSSTFSDVLAFVRQHLWFHTLFPIAPSTPRSGNIPPALLHLWLDLLCYAA